jgi:hypothetical protein
VLELPVASSGRKEIAAVSLDRFDDLVGLQRHAALL